MLAPSLATGFVPQACSLKPQALPPMKFIEMSGSTLMSKVLEPHEIRPEQLRSAGLTDKCLVRINQQGDIEVRRNDRWDVIGGLLGDFDHRIKQATGLDWA